MNCLINVLQHKISIICLFLFLCLFQYASAQGVSVNNFGLNPDPSAILDVQSSEQGMLVPRMTSSNRVTIASPATGLLVYDLDTNSFWYFDGFGWIEITNGALASLLVDADGDTDIQVELLTDEDRIRFQAAGEERLIIDSTGLVSKGAFISGYTSSIPDSGSGPRLMWIPQKSAFQAGSVDGNSWTVGKIGDYTFTAGGDSSENGGAYGFMGGGVRNTIIPSSERGVILGGHFDTLFADNAGIIGGIDNELRFSGTSGFIGGGEAHLLDGFKAFIVGGDSSNIFGEGSGILGGSLHYIETPRSVIAGGKLGSIYNGRNDFIGGGELNTVTGSRSAIIGGLRDSVAANEAVIAGGANNNISNLGDYGFIAGGDSNVVNLNRSAIIAGQGNEIVHSLLMFEIGMNFIGGGLQNKVGGNYNGMIGGAQNTIDTFRTAYSVVAGGFQNELQGSNNFLGGGNNNKILDDQGAIVGGSWHLIGTLEDDSYGFIGGGANDTLIGLYSGAVGGNRNVAVGDYAFMGGGEDNEVAFDADRSTIIGGSVNRVEMFATDAFLAGGDSNIVNMSRSAIIGGQSNEVVNSVLTFGVGMNFIGGGYQNNLGGNYNGLIGGSQNKIDTFRTEFSFMGGGFRNQLQGSGSFIGGGTGHRIFDDYGAIAGGADHFIGTIEDDSHGFIGGGSKDTLTGRFSGIIGGNRNGLNADYSFIGGGEDHDIDIFVNRSAILAGQDHVITGFETENSVILGGQFHQIEADHAIIGGGDGNAIRSGATRSFIAGGELDSIASTNSFIGGGAVNLTLGEGSAILGGIGNTAPSYGEVVLGNYATIKSSSSANSFAAADRAFSVGNGDSPVNRSNAFTVYKNGNAIVGGDDPGSFKFKIKQSGSFGLNIENTGVDDWEIYVSNLNGDLDLYANSGLVGSFDPISGNYTATSDARLKTAILPMSSVLDQVMQLQPSSYQYKRDPSAKRYLGFLAQDVARLFPELVSEPSKGDDKSDIYTMNYAGFGIVAIKAIQEQQKTIASLQQQLNQQDQLISALMSRMEALENQ